MRDWKAYVQEKLPMLRVPPERESEIVNELSSQLEQAYRDALLRGGTENDAEAAARLQFPDWRSLARAIEAAEKTAPAPRVTPSGATLAGISQDFRLALRVLRRAPAFSLVTIATLAAGIGANTAMFHVVDTVLFQPLSLRDPARLVALHENMPQYGQVQVPWSTLELRIFENAATSYESIGAYENVTAELSGVETSRRVVGARMTASMSQVLGVDPLIGRFFDPREDVEGSSEIVISYRFWQQHFARDPNVIGRAVTLDRRARTVIGVMPETFEFPLRGPAANNQPADFYVPMGFTALELQGRGPSFTKSAIGRLKAGVDLRQARAEADALASRVAERFPPAFRASKDFRLLLDAQPLQEEVTGDVKRILLLLLAAVGLILLIACANIANLMLTRAAGRRREMAIRVALGAGRFWLIRQLMAESLVLAFSGGVLGLLAARWLTPVLIALSPADMPRSVSASGFVISGRILLFTLGVSVSTALLFGLLPALQASTIDGDALKDGGRGSTGSARRRRLLSALVSVQFALTVILLVAGGLMVRSLGRLLDASPGFQPDGTVAVSSHLPASAYPKAEQVRTLYRKVADAADATPGVKAAGVGTDIPLGDWEKRGFHIEGGDALPEGVTPVTSHVWITGRYLEALGVPLIRGRFFEPVEYSEKRDVVLISETTARTFWPNQDPVGKRMQFGAFGWIRVVGVVGDVKVGAMNAAPPPETYEPHTQIPDRLLEMPTIEFLKDLHLVVRSTGDAMSQFRIGEAAIHGVDSTLAIAAERSLAEVVAASSKPQRFHTFLVGGFGVIALILAVLGVASVLGYSVAQRKGEIGIRLALGATPRGVAALVLRQGLGLAAVGIILGIVAALLSARLLAAYLYGVSPYDALTFLTVPALLLSLAAIAAWMPARRAAHMDPLDSLRAQS